MTARARMSVVVAVLVCAALPAVVHAKDRLRNIPLQWRPTTPISEFGVFDLSKLGQVTTRLDTLADRRVKRELIGENREDVQEGKVLPVTTRDNVAAFCSDNLAKLFEKVGLQVTDSGGDVVVGGEVKSFFVTETEAYAGDVTLKIEVHDRAGALLWSGLTSGGVKRWGRSYKAENYYEVLSDSLMEAVFRLLRNQNFLDALQPR